MEVKLILQMDKVLKGAREASNRELNKLGGYTRKVAQQSIRIDPKPSPRGTPPHSRKGLLKKAIIYAVDSEQQNVVIGPTANVVGPAGEPHEYGGDFRGERFEARPFMGPAFLIAQQRLSPLWANSVK